MTKIKKRKYNSPQNYNLGQRINLSVTKESGCSIRISQGKRENTKALFSMLWGNSCLPNTNLFLSFHIARKDRRGGSPNLSFILSKRTTFPTNNQIFDKERNHPSSQKRSGQTPSHGSVYKQILNIFFIFPTEGATASKKKAPPFKLVHGHYHTPPSFLSKEAYFGGDTLIPKHPFWQGGCLPKFNPAAIT